VRIEPVGSAATRVVETHVSTLFFVDDLVLKRKRPVVTAFVDFSNPDERRRACEREVELNRRLSPDVYLGVADLVLDGRTLEHVVVMRRLPEERRLSRLLDTPHVATELHHIVHRIAAFHAEAARGPDIDAAATPDHLRALWEAGLDELASLPSNPVAREDIERARTLAFEYIEGRRPLFEDRIAGGHAVDGHGDLMADDIFCLDDGPRILDCLEFDDGLRHGDTLLDVAFLAMDLERLGHPELATTFLAGIRALGADSWPASLADHYVAYRAHVRSKVAAIRVDQGDGAAAPESRRLHQMALEHLDAARVHMVVVGGSPGTGKSVLSRELADRLGAVVLSSDEIRDELLPRVAGHADDLHAGRYTQERRQLVYDELLDRARGLLGRGESVVLDASWLERGRRRLARALAVDTRAALTELRTVCSTETARARIRRRQDEGIDPSEATAAIALQLDDEAPPWAHATVIDTDVPFEEAVGLAECVVTVGSTS
jgi:aminoglycoside phosphotransferase family enzyme/predicted kinase